MDAIWGPALDAEVAYRQERAREASRPRVRRADRTTDRTADRQAEQVADPPAGPVAAPRAPRPHRDEWEGRRGWVLRGSGAWPEAR